MERERQKKNNIQEEIKKKEKWREMRIRNEGTKEGSTTDFERDEKTLSTLKVDEKKRKDIKQEEKKGGKDEEGKDNKERNEGRKGH